MTESTALVPYYPTVPRFCFGWDTKHTFMWTRSRWPQRYMTRNYVSDSPRGYSVLYKRVSPLWYVWDYAGYLEGGRVIGAGHLHD